MNNSSFSREVRAILLTLVFCASGFLAIWVAKSRLEMKEEAVYIAFLLLPLLIYLIAAGRLLEFKAFGAEAKFADIAKQSVEVTLNTIEPSVLDTEIVAKEGVKELQKIKDTLDETKPITLTLVLGRHNYDRSALEKYIETLSQCPTFKGMVILNSSGTFSSYFPPRTISAILRSPDGDEFVQNIKEQRAERLQHYPGAVKRALTKKSTNLDALNEMTSLNLDALIVLNEEGKLSGVIERQQLISKLLLAMAKASGLTTH